MSKANTTKDDLSWFGMLRFLWQLFDDLRPRFVYLFAFAVVLQFYELVPPIIVGRIVDFFTDYEQGEPIDTVVQLIIFLGILHLVMALLRVPTRLRLKNLFTEVTYRTKVEGFSRLIDFSLKWHEQENSGNKYQRLQHGVTALENLGRSISSGSGVSVTILRVVMVIAAFAVLNPILVTFGIVYVVGFISIHRYFARKAKALLDERNARLETATGSFYEGLTNVLTLKSLGGKDAFKGRVSSAEAIVRDYEIKVTTTRNVRVRFFHVEMALGLVAFLGILSWLFLRGDISLGDILVYYSYFNRLLDNTWELADLTDEMQNIKQGLARLQPIFHRREFANTGEGSFPPNWRQLKVDSASFSYKEGEREFKLADVDLVINRGEIIGIAGRSGSGKSTLVRLLLGLYQLQEGAYRIDDRDFYSISHDEVVKHMSIVLQESELFNMTLRENITLLSEEDPERLAKAIEVAQLQSVIEKLPQGLETLIGEKGYRISGGERQRLGIARAIYKNADILILDEATSNLDAKTESALQHALESELAGKTMVIIAHRLSTLKNVDRIYLFEQGRIVETGNFSELINDQESKFAELYHTQLQRTQLKGTD